jgi:SpoIIAA-like
MIEEIADMPPKTVGLRVWDEVTAADYTDVLMPAVRRAVGEHGEIRLVFQAGPDFRRFTAGMMGADVTKGLTFGVENWSAWKRMAVVTDVDWLRHAMQMMGWMTPGEARLFALDELPQAKEWVAGA